MGEANEARSVIPGSVIDADGHLCEPARLWEDNLPTAMRDRGIRLRWNEATGYDECLVEDRMATDRGLVGLGNAGESFADFGRGRHYEDLNPAGFDPHERVKVLDAEGIDVSVMYPGLGLKLGAIQDPDLAVASLRGLQRLARRLVRAGARPARRCRRAPDAGPEARGRRSPSHRVARPEGRFRATERVQRPPLPPPGVHARVGSAERDRPPDRVPSRGPHRHAGRVARARTPHGAGHAPRAHPPDRPAAHALEPDVRRRARTVPGAEGDRARVRRRVDRALDGPDGRVPRELRVGNTRAVAHAARVLPTAVLDLLRSRRTHCARAVADRRQGPLRLGKRLPAQRREVPGCGRRAARIHRGHGSRRASRAVRAQRARRCTRSRTRRRDRERGSGPAGPRRHRRRRHRRARPYRRCRRFPTVGSSRSGGSTTPVPPRPSTPTGCS